MSRSVQVIVFVLAIVVVFFLALALRAHSLPPVSSGPAPDFTLQTFDGQSLTLSALRGQVVVVNFWASWCAPCREEAAFLEQTWRTYKDRGVVFIGVDYVDTDANARAYLKEFGITYPSGPDLGTTISQAYRIKGVPETYLISKEGIVSGNAIGPILRAGGAMSQAQFIARLESLLTAP